MAATQGHTQSLHTNSFDEALALPTDFCARIARNTQLFLQQESGHLPRRSTRGAAATTSSGSPTSWPARAWEHISEVEATGGMAEAIEAGIPKLRIEEAAARTQARIDSGRQTVVGVNKYRLDEDEDIDVLKVDNAGVRAEQIAKLERLRAERDDAAVSGRARRAHQRCADTGEGNLLALAVDAARAKATVGEISDALEKVFGRHVAEIRTISGVYRSEVGDDERPGGRGPRARGRRVRRAPRVAGRASWSPRWARTATTAARRSSPPPSPTSASTSTSARCSRRRPRRPARPSRPTCTSSASSSLAAGHLTLVPELKAELDALGRGDILIVVGGVIPPQDFDELPRAGRRRDLPARARSSRRPPPSCSNSSQRARHARRVAVASTASTSMTYVRRCRRRRPHRGRPGDHAGREHPAPTTEPLARELLQPAPAAHRRARTGSASPACPASARARSSTRSAPA